VSNTQQADSEIHEDQLLNFLVNTLNQEVALDLAADVQIDAQDIYKVLVGACVTGPQSLRSATLVRIHWLPTQFSTIFEQVANTLLRRDIAGLLSEQVEVCADLHLRPYYGDKADTDGLYHS